MALGRGPRLLRLVLLGFVFVHLLSVVYEANGFSMVRRYKLDDDYSSIQHLKDLIDFDYAEEMQDREGDDSADTPVKRQQNQGGTCTCTCETRPVEEEPAKGRPPVAQYPEAAGSLLRTGAGIRPQTASRVLERPQQQQQQQQKPSAATAKEPQPWNFYGAEAASKTDHQRPEPSSSSAKQSAKENEGAKSSTPPPPPSPETFAESTADKHDAWGHNRRFPWKHLPDTMCFRESCNKDSDCCMRYNLCDRSAKVCVDCWYGSICTTEQDCCQRFPYCKKPAKAPTGAAKVEAIPNGKCVSKE